MATKVRTTQVTWALAGAVLLLGSCSDEQPSSNADDQSPTSQSSEALTSPDSAQLAALTKDMGFFTPLFKVRPVLNCVDKVSTTQFIAHFGYINLTTSTQTINVGPLNRFFPDPANRGQSTVFSAGLNNNQFQVPFDGTLLIWGLDGNAAFANSASARCPTPPPPPKCPTTCDDHNPCTADICDATTAFRCVHKALSNGVSCSDGNACNGQEVCRDGVCRAGKPPVCQDSNFCTANTCDPKRGCVFVPKSDGTSCPVSGNCGAGGTCKAGACQAKTPNCDDHNPCTADTCQSGSVCKHTPVAVGTSCSDGNFCDGAEVCNAKAQCKAPSRPDCDDHNVCTIDSCLVAGGCGHVPGNHGRKCTTTAGTSGKCDDGICQPDTAVCNDDGNPCTAEVIDPTTGACTHPPLPDDTACNDKNLCTQKDVCKSGVCTGTVPVVCAGATACTTSGVCNPSTGLCQSGTPKPNGTTCDDNNLCTSGDVCQSGTCKGTPTVCTGDQCHAAGTCDPTTGVCFNPNVVNGTACNDSVKCTSADVCTDGVCGGSPVVCAPLDSCHESGTCDETAGTCSNPISADGKTCSDGNACTQTDVCAAGVCKGSNPVQCSGTSACTTAGTCNPMTGMCTGGTPKPNGTACDDGSKCTSNDSCTAGTCGGVAVVCTALDTCHDTGTCDPGTGTCSNPVSADGKICSDGNACTQTDTCSSGSCVGSNPVACQGETPCASAGVCQPSNGQCLSSPKQNGTPCDDGQNCTASDICTNGTCGGSPVVCPAPADACHLAGTCVAATGQCTTINAPDGTKCSDGNGCTLTDMCSSGTCVGSNPVVCRAGDQCNNGGVCDPGTGLCSNNTPKANGTACSDGIACTTGDVCSGGSCAGQPKTCPSGQTCTESSGGICLAVGPCAACEQAHVLTGECDPQIGCENIKTGAADVALCVALHDCMLTTACWVGDPQKCVCGTATGTDCLTTNLANGACKAEFLAAVKETDLSVGLPKIYDLKFPAGFATQDLSCIDSYCSANSSPPSTACPVNACPDDGNPCTKEVVVNGVCQHVAASDGTSCSDGNACTQLDTCQAGACVPGTPVQCGGGSSCTQGGSCDPSSGLCVAGGAKPDGTPCDDGVKCTTGDVCTSGTCGGTAVSCSAPATCDETDGQCRQTCNSCVAFYESPDQGLCDPGEGCDRLTDPGDKALCQAAQQCVINNHCAVGTKSILQDCFCGSAVGAACLSAPTGPCVGAFEAAAKSTNPPNAPSASDAATQIFDLATPLGHAGQLIQCEHDFCAGPAPLCQL